MLQYTGHRFYKRGPELTSIIDKRRSLHRRAAQDQQQIEELKSQIGQLHTLANIGTATTMIAHELNNLLTPLANYATLALDNPDDKALAEKALQKVLRNSRRASKMMESMLALANGEKQQKQANQLLFLVEEVFACLCRDFNKDGIGVEIEISEDLTVWAVPVQIQQVLMNVILNAREAMLEQGGTLTIRGKERNEAVVIEVVDTGCGIEPARLDEIFQPFFSTKRGGESTREKPAAGLGLAFCRRVVDAHGGSISVQSEPNHGTTLRISLPRPRSEES